MFLDLFGCYQILGSSYYEFLHRSLSFRGRTCWGTQTVKRPVIATHELYAPNPQLMNCIQPTGCIRHTTGCHRRTRTSRGVENLQACRGSWRTWTSGGERAREGRFPSFCHSYLFTCQLEIGTPKLLRMFFNLTLIMSSLNI